MRSCNSVKVCLVCRWTRSVVGDDEEPMDRSVALGTPAMTALAFYLLSDLGPGVAAILKAFGAGALIAVTAETMVPEAFQNGPRYSGLLAALGFVALILLSEVAKRAANRRQSRMPS